ISGAVPPVADKKGFGIVTTASSAGHSRRDFLFVATGAAAVVGAAATVWPLVSQMNPDATTIAAGAPIEVDISPLRHPQANSARVKEGHDNWLLVIGIFTHLGCNPIAHESSYDGFFCP